MWTRNLCGCALWWVLGCGAERTAHEPSLASGGSAAEAGSTGAGIGGGGGAAGGGGAGTNGSGGSAEAGSTGAGIGGSGVVTTDPGTEVDVRVPETPELDALTAALAAVSGLDAATLVASTTPVFTPALDYDPLTAARLAEIQASALALDSAEFAKLGQLGFVVSARKTYPSFVNGYVELYGEHLPLYISADSILNAVHRSYDSILETVEATALVPALSTMLEGMRARLAAGASAELGAAAVGDADLYLAVALGLLEGAPVGPVASGSAAAIAELYGLATDGEGLVEGLELFGSRRDVDFSQYTPRGHYANSEVLGRYFRAMTWLGLGELRLVEPTQNPSGEIVYLFRRRQLELAYALGGLLDGPSRAAWQSLDDTIAAFVGEADNMTVPELNLLLADLGLASASELVGVADDALAQAILGRGYGGQKIAGQVLQGGVGQSLPLASTFLLLGKRYVVDSHVFSNVVYDRVQGTVLRLMPNPLDVAYAALGNDAALPLLLPELETYGYAPELEGTRLLVDAHSEGFWGKNLYNDWLSALRALSPSASVSDPKSAGMPLVTGTRAWSRRILNTQLASWAELRHDTVLYAKQSYSGVPACEFPDAYVDPYPEAFAALARFAEHGIRLATSLPALSETELGSRVAAYFEHLQGTAGRLRDLAEKQRTGTEYSADDLAFVNGIVADSEGCFFDPRGWYAKLVWDYESERDTEYDPTIADVHTQPADEDGNVVGRVLHVGTGPVRALVVSVDTCTGPRAYVGLASSYFEHVTSNFDRLTDERWLALLDSTPPPGPPWVDEFTVPSN